MDANIDRAAVPGDRRAAGGRGVMGARRGKPIPYFPVYDLYNVYSYHKPSENDITRHAAIRGAALTFAAVVLSNAGSGRERSLALTQIEQAMFWANAAIAREPDE